MTVHIRDARLADLDSAVTIERLSFPDPWSAAMFRAYLHDAMYPFLVAVQRSAVLGFAIAQTVVDESDLLNIAVHPEVRTRGVGTLLLDALLARCAAWGAESMTLDVRESNTAARAFYTSRGFTQVGRRRRYYHKPEEDGLILRATLPVATGRPVISP